MEIAMKLLFSAHYKVILIVFSISVAPIYGAVSGVIDPNSSLNGIEASIKKELTTSTGIPISLFMAFFDQSKIPAPIKTALDKVTLQNVVVNRTLTTIRVAGSAQFADAHVEIDLQIEKGPVNGSHFKIVLPKGFKLSHLVPQIKAADVFVVPAGWLVVSNHTYMDPSFHIPIIEGVTYVASMAKNDLALNNEIANIITSALGSVVDTFFLYAHIPSTGTNVDLLVRVPVPEEKEVALSKVFSLDKLPLPSKVKVALDNTKIIKPIIYLTVIASKVKDLFFEGGINLFGQQFILKLMATEVRQGVYIAPGAGRTAMSCTFAAQSAWKFGNLIPELKFLDGIQLRDSSFVLSNYDYRDLEFNIDIRAGFNVRAGITLTGALNDVKMFVDKILSNKKLQEAGGMTRYIPIDQISLYCSAYLSADLQNIKAVFELPVKIGVDFFELYKDKKLKNKPVINKITTTGFKFAIEAAKDRLAVSGEAGIYVFPSMQSDPLVFAGGVSLKTNGVELYGFMKGVYEPAFGASWLSLGSLTQPAGLSLFFDYTLSGLAAVFGIPLPTGVKIAGGIGIGRKEHRTNLNGIVAFEITAEAMSSFFISGSIDQIDLGRLLQILESMGNNKVVLAADIPGIKFSNLTLTIAPQDTVIFDTQYRAGLFASGTAEINSFKGSSKIALTSFDQRLFVQSYVNPIKTSVFELTGYGLDKKLGTDDDKARLEIDIAAVNPLDRQKILLDGLIKIPPIMCQGSMLFDLSRGNLDGHGTVALLNEQLAADAKLFADLDQLTLWSFTAQFKSDFDTFFIDGIKGGFEAFKENAQKDIDSYEQKINKASGKFDVKAQAEIDETKNRLAAIEKELSHLSLDSDEKLSKADLDNLHVSNHSGTTLYCAIYYVDDKGKKKESSKMSGDIVTLKPYKKNQIHRPKWKIGKDRELYVTDNKSLLRSTLNREEAKKMVRDNTGATGNIIAKYHITYDGSLKIYDRNKWNLGPGKKIVILNGQKAVLVSYLEVLLKPGTKAAKKFLDKLVQLKKIPEVFVKISEEVINLMLRSVQIIKIRQATLTVFAQELLRGASPRVSVDLECALPGKKAMNINVTDVQFDIQKPAAFFATVASVVMFQVIPQFKNLTKDIEDMPEYKEIIEVPDL